MGKWIEIASAVYYTGVGAVLLGTSVRFLYKLIQEHDRDRELLNELRELHIPYMYKALQLILHKMHLELEAPAPMQHLNQKEKSGFIKLSL